MNGRRGSLKVFLGAAPGVGKTYAMLEEAHSLSKSGTDVVVGVVHTHGRAGTAAKVEGLELIPTKKVLYRGSEYDELDVDAILERRPEVVLVDELAHTIVGAESSCKRWQDVETILNAGIDVISTVNIQHVESLNDVVADITGHVQNETIPDAVLRNADDIELIDLSPDALRIRLRRGQIYKPAAADAALSRFFRKGNLTALRELALLWLADQVDEGLAKYRNEEGIHSTWPARERILVAVAGGPHVPTLIRRGMRIVGRMAGRELVVVHIVPTDGAPLMADTEIQQARTLTESLGGTWHTLSGEDYAETLLEFANTINATQLVIGSSRTPWYKKLLSRPTSSRIIDGAGDIDVHIVTNHGAGEPQPPRRRPRRNLSVARTVSAWVLAGVCIAGITAMGISEAHEVVAFSTLSMAYVLVVVVVALVGGLWPALASAVVGTGLLNWFFTEPLHTMSIAEPENIFLLFVFIVVAALVARVVDGAARRTQEARTARANAQLMTELAGSVIREGVDIQAILDKISQAFGQDSVTLGYFDDNKSLVTEYRSGKKLTSANEADETFTLDDHHVLLLAGRPLNASEQRVLDAYTGRLVGLMTQTQLTEARLQARQLEAANAIRTALLSAVSHDLRTPLATIKTSVSGLLLDDVDLPKDLQAELLRSIEASSDRLDRIVADLLDMSRVQTNTLNINESVIGPSELVARTVDHMDPTLKPEPLEIAVPNDLPLVRTDASLVERILENLLSNAAKHTDNGVKIDAAREGDRVAIRVIDFGPGLSDEAKQQLFTPFTRMGDTTNSRGLGLGAAVAKGLAEGIGGELVADDTPGGGLTMVLSLPIGKVIHTPFVSDHMTTRSTL